MLPVVAALPLLAAEGGAQGHAGRLDVRASCYRALAEWTTDRRADPSPFHVRPAVAALLGPGADPSRTRTEVGLGGRTDRGVLRAGESVPTDEGFRYPGPTSVPDRRRVRLGLLVREKAGPFALVGDASLGGGLEVPVAQVALRLRSVVVSGGREGPWSGHGCSSGLVASGRGRADGVGLDTPWFDLPLLGPLSASAFFGTLPEASSDNPRPFFLVQRAVWPLGDDVRLGLTRAAIFGGEETTVPVTPRTVGLMLLGITDVEGKDSDFENQVASMDLSWRIPAGASAIRLHMEYAADDFALAFLRVPALSLGGEVVTPRDDGIRGLGAELTWMAPSSGSFPEWYRHGALAWGWTDRGVLLGHDLGGEGWGLRVEGFAASGAGEITADLLVARRGGENLLAPDARGWGVEARTEGRWGVGAWAGGRVLVGWHLEAGRLGTHHVLRAGLSAIHRF